MFVAVSRAMLSVVFFIVGLSVNYFRIWSAVLKKKSPVFPQSLRVLPQRSCFVRKKETRKQPLLIVEIFCAAGCVVSLQQHPHLKLCQADDDLQVIVVAPCDEALHLSSLLRCVNSVWVKTACLSLDIIPFKVFTTYTIQSESGRKKDVNYNFTGVWRGKTLRGEL